MTHDYQQYIDAETPKANPDKNSEEMVEGFQYRAVCRDCGWQNWRVLRGSATRSRDAHMRENPGHEVRIEEIDDWEELAREVCGEDGE